jgi:UDP-N-acetylglucosamine transferase subunit ALG13
LIFVTVGTTMPFDELVEEVDRFCGEGFFDEKVVCQTGQSRYVPKFCEHFRYAPDVGAYLASASFLIIHGGTGSVIEAMPTNKPFPAFANPRAADDHQGQFLSRIEKEHGVVWSRNCGELSRLFFPASKRGRRIPSGEPARLAGAILDLCSKK